MSETVELTAQVVAAFLTQNQVAVDELPALIHTVHKTLNDLAHGPAEPVAAEPVELQPAVPVRRSVTPDTLTCLVCGEQHKMLKRHLSTSHDMTPADYRQAFSLKPDYPMAAPNYAQQRRELALTIGLGRKRAEAA